MDNKLDILSMTYKELEDKIVEMGEPKYRAKQVYSWISKGIWGDKMTNVPKSLIEKLNDNFVFRLPQIEKKLVSKLDSTKKYLLKLYDGECIESVFMKYEHGNTICISSQVGCRMGCRFCASTIAGKVRDLFPSEMIGQIIAVENDTEERISNVVMMGIGEPLDNYENTVKFLKIVSSEESLNIGLRHISVSTCGLVDKICEFAKENLPVTLSISLHAYDDEVRSSIMPINNKYNIKELLSACEYYFGKTGRRISFEYTLIADKNDTQEGAEKLAKVLKTYIKTTPHVNLIPLNEVSERDFVTSKRVNAFKEKLIECGINATVRRKLGSDINASCGQLRRQSQKEIQ